MTDRPASALQPVGIDHVGLAVPDLDAAIAFHTEVLGGRLAHRETNVEQGVEEAMIAFDQVGGDDGKLSEGAGTGRHGTQIQLLAPLSPESTIAKFLDRNGPGLQQLAYRVTDVDAAQAAAVTAGLRVLYPTARRGTAGSRVNFIHPKDTGGVLIELVEPAAQGPEHHG